MKRNIIAISLMAAGLFTFGNVYAETNTCTSLGQDANYRITLNNGDYACEKSLVAAIKDVTNNEDATGEITFLKDMPLYNVESILITKDMTIDLNGHTATFNQSAFEINGANVTFKNGTMKVKGTESDNLFTVKSTNGETSLTFEKDITLKAKVDDSNKIKANVIKVDNSASNKTTININGDWIIPNEIIDCDGGDSDGNLTVNLNATIKSSGIVNSNDKYLLNIDAGTSTINIIGGEYTIASDNAIKLTNGILNISGGKISAPKGNAIFVSGSNINKPLELNITGGELNASCENCYAVRFGGGTADGTYSFSGGTYTSGKDSKGKYHPAFLIDEPTFLTKQTGIITGGTYNHGIVADTEVENGVKRPAANAIKTLLASNLDYTEGEDGTITVAPAKTEEQQPPVEQTGNQAGSDNGTGDNTIDDSPQTYDGIMSYVTMALTSIGAVALSLKKVLSR